MKAFKFLALILSGLFFFTTSPQNVLAQGSIQVTVSGIPPILPSPYVSDVERNYRQGMYSFNIHYSNSDPAPVAFIVEVSLTRYGEELFRMSSTPVVYSPGNYFYSTFQESPVVNFPEDPLDLISGRVQEQVVREGIMPEGDYILEVEVSPEDPFQMITSIPSVTPFQVRFPQPPVLMAPEDGGTAPQVFPVFSWTPVIGMMPAFQFEYELLIVELLEGQTPLQAIESNREHERIVTMQPALVYTNEYFQLENGKEYAWQVRAKEVNDRIPLSDRGRTEIFTFTAGDILDEADIGLLEKIELVRDFAELINLDNLDITESAHSVTLDGTATLRLDFSNTGEGYTEIDVICYGLEVQIGDPQNPIITAGTVSGDIRGELLPVEGAGEIVSLERIRWGLAEGLTIDASIIDPSGQFFEAEGTLNLSAMGLQGTITATGPAGEPLFHYGEHPVELALNSVTATFPGAFLTADASLEFFNEPTPCYIPGLSLTGDGAEISMSCPIDFDLSLVPGTDLASLHLGSASGYLLIGEENASFDYSFNLVSSIRLNAPGDEHYNLPVSLELSSETGVTADIRPPPITYHSPGIDLGIADMHIGSINDPWITYNPSDNSWDFGFEFDAGLKFPSLDDLELPDLYGIELDRNGIHFPDVHFDEDDLSVVPRLSLAGFGARLTSFTIPSFTFPWFEWDGFLPGPWDFEFDFELSFPRFPNHMPSCLRNLTIDVEDAGFSGGQLSAAFPPTSFGADECGFEIGAGYELLLNSLEGGLTGTAEPGGFAIDGYLSLDALLLLGTPFDCESDSPVQLGADNLTMNSEGVIYGQLAGIVPACPLAVGPYEAMVTESMLTFSAGENGQSAHLQADAYLEFPMQSGSTNRFDGEVGIDLISGEFTALEFVIDEPFVWTIPARDEVLSFEIGSASISLDGLMIDGSQEFIAGNHTIEVFFNELLLELTSFTIKEGNILFSEAFALEAGIDPGDHSLTYRSVPIEDQLSLDPGIFFGLAGMVQIGADGLTTEGTADAEISFAGFEIADLSVEFSEDFAFGLDPFKVQDGQIDIIYGDNLVAIVDRFGFHPVFSFFDEIEAIIPERLPLPNSSVAYLQLKDEQGNLLLDVEQDPENDLAVIMGTRPGEPVELFLPVLQGDDLATAPSVGVEFSNVGISLAPMNFESGEIHVDVSGMAEFLNLEERFGIPFSLEHISYGRFEELHELYNEGLFFTGELMLFDEQLGENSNVSMFVRQDGTVLASFDVDNIDKDIPLVPGSDIAVMNIDEISGTMEFPLLTIQAGGIPYYNFMINGGFAIQYGDNMARAGIVAGYDRQGFSLLDFEYDYEYEIPSINIDPFIFRIEEIKNLHLDYRRETGFDFYAGLDLHLGMKMEEDELLIPLKGVEIRPSGFVIPYQEINDGTEPRLTVPGVNLFGFHLQPLAFRMDGAEVDIYNFSPGDLAGLLPRVDFAITFPELAESNPSLADLSLTVNDAGYSNGNFTGSVEVYNPLVPPRIPMGSTFLDVYELAGELREIIRDGETVQGIDIFISGSVPGVDIFESEEPCDPVNFSLAIVQGRGFSGTVENFVPCGSMPVGPLSLMFTHSQLEFGFEEGKQSVILAGGAELEIPRPGDETETATASGTIEMDLLTGELLDGSIDINNAFRWSLPAGVEDPFFTFIVNSARLDSEGLTLRAAGDMQVTEDILVDVLFDDLVIGLPGLDIKGGRASITTGFAFDLLFTPVSWRIVHFDREIPADTNVIRLNLDGIGMILDSEGVTLTGESTADLFLAQKLTQTGEQDEPEDPAEPEDPEEDSELDFPGLRLAFVDDFSFDWQTYSVNSGAAELYLEEDDEESLLIAWYDRNGLGLGDILGVLPIPDTLALPQNEIAYLVLRETDPDSPDFGDLLVELDSGPGQDVRTLRTKEGKSVKLVLESLSGEEDNPPSFLTQFSVTVNSVLELVDGSIDVDLQNNPFKVPDMPLEITGLAYEKRDDGVASLMAAAKLELPESLGDLVINMDELRFSTQGFEQATFSVGDPSSNLDTLAAVAFADSALCINLFYATASFGEEKGFGIRGTLESNLLTDEEKEMLSSIPFESLYDVSELLDEEWRFEFDLDELQRDSLALSHARLWLTEVGAVASRDNFNVTLSGVVSMPDLLGDDFAVTVSQLSLGTDGISVGGVDVQADSQEFSLFADRVKIGVDQVRPEFEDDTRIFYLGFDGSLEVLERTASFTNMVIGTDGSFGVDELDVELLADNLVIIENHLVITDLNFGITEENRMQFLVGGEATLPDPFAAPTSPFSVSITQTDRQTVDVEVEDIGFTFEEQERPTVYLGEVATFSLTAVDLDIDFKQVRNTTFYASAELEIHSDDPEQAGEPGIIKFGESTNIKEEQRHGLRYNYDDGLSWHITEQFTGNEKLFGFSAGFFSVEVRTVVMPEDQESFVVEIGGKTGINVPALSGSAEFEGFRIGAGGITERGKFRGDGGLEATLMNVVNLSLGNFEYDQFEESDPYMLTIFEDDVAGNGNGEPDPDNPAIRQVEVLEYLLVENASISLNGEQQENGNGSNGEGKDMWGGGVERILIYRTSEGISLNVDHAHITIPAAHIDVSMTYHTIGGRSLSVAGTGQFGFDDTGVNIGVAGKIARTTSNELSFGLFVKAEVDPGIPVIPGIVTLKGLGGGFYYNPEREDFTAVRTVAGLEYLKHPEFAHGIRFAAFLYAGVGIIGEQEYFVDGDFFMEVTNQATSLHVDAELFYQGERLKSYMYLGVEYGDNPMVQGLCSLNIDYSPALHGGGEIGFFAKPGPVWAVYGETDIDFFIVNTKSDFIVCNDGLLADLEISAGFETRFISLDGSLDASVWYLREEANMGAYGKISAVVSAGGASIEGHLFGAIISTQGERLLYAQGEVNVDLILWDGAVSAWASYSSAGWQGGRGTSPEFEAKINEARSQAERLREAAEQAAADVADAINALEEAKYIEELMAELDLKISDYRIVEERRNQMNQNIEYVMSLEGDVTERLRSTIDHTEGIREHTEMLVVELENPVTLTRGTISGDKESLVVDENPTIKVDQSIAQKNEAELENYMENIIVQQLGIYEEAIAATLLNLRELELMIHADSEAARNIASICRSVLGSGFDNMVSPVLDSSIDDHIQQSPGGGGGYFPSGPSDFYNPQYTQQSQPFQSLLMPSTRNFNYMSEKYTEAVESVKKFYSTYISRVYFWHNVYLYESDEHHAQAAEQLLVATEERFDEIFPPLVEMHAAFTGSLDLLYTMKAEISAILYGMIEDYLFLREEIAVTAQRSMQPGFPGVSLQPGDELTATGGETATADGDVAAEMAQLRDEIAQMLEPPVITSLVINPGDPFLLYTMNWADISWQAEHPDRVAETSYFIESTARGRLPGQFTSAGLKESLSHYTWKSASDLVSPPSIRGQTSNENTYNIMIRARGSGGNTTIRSTTVSLKVDAGGESSTGGEQLHEDVPPPSVPNVELPYRSVKLSGYGSGGGSGLSTLGTGSRASRSVYYTNDPSRIELTITAHDDHSDIQKFEYALGSGFAGTDLVDWTEAVGVTTATGTGGSTVTRSMATSIRGLNLEHEGTYFISVRVTNGAGQSSLYSMSGPVVYDGLPPSEPERILIPVSPFATVFGTTPPRYPVVYETPQFVEGKVNLPASFAGEPAITRSWNPGEDEVSGIWGYEYVVSRFDNASQAFESGEQMFTTDTRMEISGEMITYSDTVYLHIRSKNNAGMTSTGSLTYGPILPKDPTIPTNPVVNVKVGSNSVYLYIPYLSGDFETQVKGYQYSVGTSPGGTDIKSWGSGIEIEQDIVISHDPVSINPEPVNVPVHNIPATELPVLETRNLYVNVRAVNGQDMYSGVVSSGPFRFGTRPEEPVVSGDFNSKTGELSIGIGNIFDSGAPVETVRYRVKDIETGELLTDWTIVEHFRPRKFDSPGSIQQSVILDQKAGESGFDIEVEVVNSAGKSTRGGIRKTFMPKIASPTLMLGNINLK